MRLAQPTQHPTDRGIILTIILVYAMFSTGWILVSDKLVQIIFSDSNQIILVSMLKGWLYVGMSSALLYGLMRRWLGGDSPSQARSANPRRPGRPFLMLAAIILVFTGLAMINTFTHHKETEVVRLQVIADLKTRQIADWLKARQNDADFVHTSEFFAEHYRRWQESGDPRIGVQLQTRLEQFILNRGFNAVTLLKPNGEKLWGSDRSPQIIAPPLQTAAQRAGAGRKPELAGPYIGLAGHERLDFVVPLTALPGPAPLVVLHIDLKDWLFPVLQFWPTPSASGETLLFRRDGDQVLFFNESRHQEDAAAKPRPPVAAKTLLAARGGSVEGMDYRGIPAIGVINAIAGTDWFLLTKLDQSELYADAAGDTAWIGLVGALILFMAGAGFYLMRQNQQLSLAQAVQQSQAERLRALNLLAAIADSSDDAIFAKDMEGRYTLFNRAAGHYVGKPPGEVLDHDDRALFSAEEAEMLMAFDRQVIAGNRTYTQEEVLGTPGGERIFLATKGPLHDGQGKIVGMFGISHDITQRKQDEAALWASQLNYRSLFENMINSVVQARVIFQGDTPVDIEYLSVNPAFATVTGITEPVIGRRISDVIPGYCENNPESMEIFGRVATTGVPTRWEHYLRELKRWFSFMIYSPNPGEIIIVTDNITGRRVAEEALRQSEERLQLALDASQDGLWDWDFRSGLAYLAPHYYEMTGYQPGDITPDLEFFKRTVHPDDLPRVLDALEAHMRGKTTSSEFDYRLVTATGEIKWMAGRGRVVERDGKGAPLRMIGTITDITLRKETEAAMRRQTEELAQRNAELERFNQAMVGRELNMIELKQRLNGFYRQLGKEPPYPLAFLNELAAQPKAGGIQ